MSPHSLPSGEPRPSALVNDLIREFWLRLAGRTPGAVERAEYEALVSEWAAAVRAETDVVEAA